MDDNILKKLSRGPSTAASLTEALSISQPTLSRRIAPLIEEGRIIRIGKGKNTRYVRRRNIASIPEDEPIPVYSIDERGEANLCCQVSPVEPEGCAMGENRRDPLARLSEDLSSGLPYFLEYLRPEGFLGRILCKTLSEASGLPGDARYWSEDQLIYFLYHYGADLPGNIMVGRTSLKQFSQSEPSCLSYENPVSDYEILADRVIAGETPGSSAGGEQPKFTACLHSDTGDVKHVIVKFSPEKSDDPIPERWTDLLILEWIALDFLKRKGLGEQKVRLLEGERRWMLEIERFDRVGKKGRRPWISLGAIDDELFGRRDNQRKALARMVKAKILTEEDAEIAGIASLFGDFIGNTDQHFGNLSFTWTPGTEGFRVGPFYDILPMFYSPRSGGEILQNRFHEIPVRYPEEGDLYDRSRILANEYWGLVVNDLRISDDFRRIAANNERRLR
jgi:DNA-binding transcriptional ArsR family regulator